METPSPGGEEIRPTTFKRARARPGRRIFAPSPIKLAIALVFLLLAVAVLFMFNARAVRLDMAPGDASIDVTDGYPVYLLGERHLMLPGAYGILARQEGYEDLYVEIEVTWESEQEFSFEMTRLPGILEVLAFDDGQAIEGAGVFIDQKMKGMTPAILDPVAAGTRDLYINHPRYLPYQAEVEVEGKQKLQSLDISLDPAWADVDISSRPAGAAILVDGAVMGKTPARVEILAGDRRLQLKQPGYKTWSTALSLVPQEQKTLSGIVLTRADGKLRVVTSPTGANITIAGRYHGQTPLSLVLAPGENYPLVANKAGYESLSLSFDVKPEEDQYLNLTLKTLVGQVKLMVTPADATLYVDDEARGDPNQTLTLMARRHTLRIESPGYATYTAEVIPQPGLPQQFNIIMQTEEAARISAIPQRITTTLGDALRLILPAKMQMGAGRREPGRRSNEFLKDVAMTRSYYLGEEEISNKSFRAFKPGHDSGMLGRALLNEDDRPAVNVAWVDAMRFCNWLSEQQGLPPAYVNVDGLWRLQVPVTIGYRLPTEAEWAWAARYAAGPKPSRFPWGDNMPPPPGSGNFADAAAENMVPYNIKNYEDNFRGPAPSGSFTANAFGIFDLAGNVSEWVHDYYSIEVQRKTLIDPTGPKSGDYHVIRGSNYTHGRFSELRWTFRDYGSDPRPDVGFRLARYVE